MSKTDEVELAEVTTADDPKAAKHAQKEASLADRLERYRKLRANVRRRRVAYVVLILLTIGVIALTIVDILFLNDQLKWYAVFPGYLLFFLLAIILLFSRRKHLEVLEEMRALERSLLQCPDCLNVFRFGAIRWHEHKKASFSCPVCGVYSQLPSADTPPVEAYIPAGDIRELAYHCTNCKEEFSVGTFTGTPLHEVKFRTCPNCEQKGFIERAGGNWGGSPA